ncbi:hypothetical protein Tco_0541503 [Tanacetum coccineum]
MCMPQLLWLKRDSCGFDFGHGKIEAVNEIRAERIAKNANPLALVADAQQYPYPYYQPPKSHKSYAPPSKQSSSTRSHASTRYKGKEIAKPITPPSESTSEEDSDPEQAQRDKDMTVTIACGLGKTVGSSKVCSRLGYNVLVARNLVILLRNKPKRVKDYTYYKEKMLLCKQAEKGVPLQAEQADSLG